MLKEKYAKKKKKLAVIYTQREMGFNSLKPENIVCVTVASLVSSD